MYEHYELNFSENWMYMFLFGIDINIINASSYLVHRKLSNRKR